MEKTASSLLTIVVNLKNSYSNCIADFDGAKVIRKILVYENTLADTHPAVERAIQLAQRDSVTLKIVDIVYRKAKNNFSDLHRPMRSLVEQERKDQLDYLCEKLHTQNIKFSTELLRGRPFAAIVRKVVHEGFHLVIKSVLDKKSTDSEGILGAVDLRLVRNCPCPVWLEVPKQTAVQLNNIAVAIDPQAEDTSLNNVLLDMATTLAQTLEMELHVISTWEIPEEEFLSEIIGEEKLDRYASDLESSAMNYLEASLERAGIPCNSSNVNFCKGDPAATIIDCAENLRPDLLIMGTVAQTNINGLLIGDTADTVLRQIKCSVLAVKPDSLFRA